MIKKTPCCWIIVAVWLASSYIAEISVTGLSSSSSSTTPKSTFRTVTTLTVPPALGHTEGYPSPLHHIHVVTSILTPQEASQCCEISHRYATQTGRWETPDGERHASYPTCDFPIDECDDLQDYLDSIDFDKRLFGNFSELYGVDADDMEYLDLFVAHYQAKNETTSGSGMDRLESHRDGSLLSFSLLLNDPGDFTGGGTFYDALRDVRTTDLLHEGGAIRPLQAGDACLHCGKILHGADVVTSGSRTVLVGFVDVAERNIRPGVLAEACTNWGRMDVASYRHQRQAKKHHQGWMLNNARYLPQAEHPSYIRGFAPAFASVVRRADPDYQRQKKLEAEDALLRTILLPQEERAEKISWDDDGSITIL